MVILGPQHLHKRGKEDSSARVTAKEYLESRGSSPRVQRNSLVFLAPDEKAMDDLLQAAAGYRAWNEIHEKWESYNLDAFQKNQARSKAAEYDQAVELRILQTWIHALSPNQLSPTDSVSWDEIRISGSEPLAERTANKLIKDEHLYPRMGGVRLKMELDRHLWEGRDHVSVGELQEWFPRYLYLPRLARPEVIEDAVRDGAGLFNLQDAFGVADAWDEAGERYRGLRVAEGAGVVGTGTLLLKPEVAERERDRATPDPASPDDSNGGGGSGTSGGGDGGKGGGSTGGGAPTVVLPKVYLGSVGLSGLRMGSQVGKVAEEVIQHLAALPGAKVKATLELHVEVPDGIPENIARVVRENANAMKFDHSQFEGE